MMMCSFLLYSKVNQLYAYMYFLFFEFLPICHHRALSRVPHSIQYVLISYLFYKYHIHQSQTPNSSHTLLSPLVSVHLFSMSVSLFLLCK